MERASSVILSQKKEDARTDVKQIKANIAGIETRRKEEKNEHNKQMEALEKEERAERKALVKAESRLLVLKNNE